MSASVCAMWLDVLKKPLGPFVKNMRGIHLLTRA